MRHIACGDSLHTAIRIPRHPKPPRVVKVNGCAKIFGAVGERKPNLLPQCAAGGTHQVSDAARALGVIPHGELRPQPREFAQVVRENEVGELVVLAVGLLANAAGLRLSDLNLTVLVLAAALPSASNVSLLAERFGADNGRVARIIMSSTVLAFVTFSALAWWMGVGR